MFRPNVRQRAFAAAAVAVMSFTPASYSFGQDLKPTPVAASTEGVTATTDCKAWKPGVLMASEKCEILKGEFLRAQGKALDAQNKAFGTQDKALGGQIARDRDNIACMQKVRPLVEQGKVSRDTLVKFGQDRMCDLLKTLG